MHAAREADWRENRIRDHIEHADGTRMSTDERGGIDTLCTMQAQDWMRRQAADHPDDSYEFRLRSACHETGADPTLVAPMTGGAPTHAQDDSQRMNQRVIEAIGHEGVEQLRWTGAMP